jgi:hypothetical protein
MFKKNILIHPWLFALIPIINLFEHNQDIASIYYLPNPIIITLISTIIVFFLVNIFVKNKIKSALIISAWIIYFFLFYLLIGLFSKVSDFISNGLMPYGSLALIVYITHIVAIAFLIATSHKKFNKLNKLLNFFSIIVILLQLFNILNYQYQNKANNAEISALTPEENTITKTNSEDTILPDIYYIILDGYGRQDILQNIYNYDNSPFISFLKDKGFYVADQAHSNYNQTFLSMSSSLNLNYIDEIVTINDYESNDRGILKKILKDNIVYDFLKAKDYTFVSLSSSWTGTYKNTKSDITLANDLKQNGFEIILLKKTPLLLFLPNMQIKILPMHTNSILDNISKINDIQEPTFSYVHILSPHPPFVFEPDGSIVGGLGYCMEGKDGSHYFESCPGVNKYQERYVDQLAYLNMRFETIINEILENSETPPIIILQSDHGPGSMLDWTSLENSNVQERLSILNAYYVPEETKEMLYSSITPVNSFRVLFNSLFDGQFEILEDKSYFAIWEKPYKFVDVSESLD